MAVKQGTAEIKQPAKVLKTTGDVRKIRCPICRTGLALKAPDGKGGICWKCNSCGKSFKSDMI